MNGLEDGYYKIERDELADEEIIKFVPVSPIDPDTIMLFFFCITVSSISAFIGIILFVASLIIEPTGIFELVQF